MKCVHNDQYYHHHVGLAEQRLRYTPRNQEEWATNPARCWFSSLSPSEKCVNKFVLRKEATLLKMLSCATWGVPGLKCSVLAKKSSIVKLCYKTALLGEPYLRQPGHVVP